MAMAKMHTMLCPRAPTMSNTTMAMWGHGGPPAQSAEGCVTDATHRQALSADFLRTCNGQTSSAHQDCNFPCSWSMVEQGQH